MLLISYFRANLDHGYNPQVPFVVVQQETTSSAICFFQRAKTQMAPSDAGLSHSSCKVLK